MNLLEAQKLAIELMELHGVAQAGWQFRWSHGKRILGCAQITRKRDWHTRKPVEIKTIKLSRHLVALNSDAEVRETILHEIAHAIAGVEHGHDEVWKAACRKVGAKPVRLAGEGVALVKGRYTLFCGCCEKSLGTRHRRINPEVMQRSYCKWCGPKSKGRLRVQDVYAADESDITTIPAAADSSLRAVRNGPAGV